MGPNNGLPVGNKPIKSITSTGIPTKTDVLAGQKEAYPGMKFGPNQVNVAKNTISSQGAKPGSQVTTTKNVKVTEGATGGKQTTDQNAYMSGLAKRFPGASGEELAKKIPGSKGSYISSSMIDKYNKSYYTPKTVTTGTPGAEAVVSAPIELDNEAEKQTTGENTVETKTTPDDKTTKDNKLGNLPIGSANVLFYFFYDCQPGVSDPRRRTISSEAQTPRNLSRLVLFCSKSCLAQTSKIALSVHLL